MQKTIMIMFSLFILMAIATGAVSEDESRMFPLAWVGLWNADMLEWAENANKLTRLCPESILPAEREECKKKMMMTKEWKISVFGAPSSSARALGEIILSVTPGSGFSAAYRSSRDGEKIPFKPDLYDPDWGYGPYFHQSLLETKDGWYRLPKDPFPSPVWADLREVLGDVEVVAMGKGDIYKLDGGEIVIVDISKTAILIRPEQPADMWCEPGDPPPIKQVKPTAMELKTLYDRNRHLKLKTAYPRGC